MKLTIIGAGYVGLVSGCCFAEIGHHVTCVEKDARKFALLKEAQIPIYEPGLEVVFHRNLQNGRLAFTDSIEKATCDADAVFLCVGTPPDPVTGEADLRFVYQAAHEIGNALSGYTVVVTKSTVPVGTNRHIAQILRSIAPEDQFDIASNPEFLREGVAVNDFLHPDRIIAGVDHPRAARVMQEVYAPLTEAGHPLIITSPETAEIIKYASNAFLATKISFINQIADLCEKVGGDVDQVAKGMGMDPRIGNRFLKTGPGYGGSCFPKDTQALAATARNNAVPASIVETVIDYNKRRKKDMAQKIIAACGGDIRGKTIGILGVAFKGGTDDMRESPALDILPALQAAGAYVRAYDPAAMDTASPLLPGIDWAQSVDHALHRADAAVILAEWAQFQRLDLEKIAQILAEPLLIDLRNLYNPNQAAECGLTYVSLGRSPQDRLVAKEANPKVLSP